MIRYYLIIIVFAFLFACNLSQDTTAKEASSVTVTQNITPERLHTLAERASKKGEWLKAAQLYEELYLKEPSNEAANYETGTNYLKANYPKKALAILNSFDNSKNDTTAAFNGRIARIAKARYQLNQYAEILKLVENYDYPKMYRGLAREHLKALIQLNQPNKLANFFQQYQQAGIYDDKGKSTNMGFLYRAICNELVVVGEKELLKKYANDYSDWAIKRQAKDKRNLAFSVFYQQNYLQAIKSLKEAIANEKSPRHLMELEGLLGVCYAHNNELNKAITQIQKMHTFGELPPRHDAFGAKFYHQARIEVALGQKENAISSLKKALAANAEFKKMKSKWLINYFTLP